MKNSCKTIKKGHCKRSKLHFYLSRNIVTCNYKLHKGAESNSKYVQMKFERGTKHEEKC